MEFNDIDQNGTPGAVGKLTINGSSLLVYNRVSF